MGANTNDTGNANFNAVLNGAEYDSGPHTITLKGLTAGQSYSVQLFALDDRGGAEGSRQFNYQDPNKALNISQTSTMGANVYFVGTFLATSSNMSIQQNLPTSNNGNLNALVIRALPSQTNLPPAQTNYLNFASTTVPANSGPATPANGVTSISGAGLAAGDVVVFDGLVINPNAGTSDTWGAVELNAGGFYGLTGAALGVKVETASSLTSSMWTNGLPQPNGFNFPAGGGSVKTNRLRIELTTTMATSTTNMNWVAKIDQGLTGTFSTSLAGTGVNFPGNIISLSFGANVSSHIFSPYIDTAPTVLGWQVNGGQIQLTWPPDHTGWSLQAQSNSLNAGLGTNWVKISGSAATNQFVFPIGRNNGSVFFRLIYQ